MEKTHRFLAFDLGATSGRAVIKNTRDNNPLKIIIGNAIHFFPENRIPKSWTEQRKKRDCYNNANRTYDKSNYYDNLILSHLI